MDIQSAKKIMTMLASGVDPDTGEATLLSRNVTNALWRILAFVEYCEKRRDATLLPNRGKSWTQTEDAQVCSEFAKRMSFARMAEVHGRTRGAIISRLQHLGKIEPTYVFSDEYSAEHARTRRPRFTPLAS